MRSPIDAFRGRGRGSPAECGAPDGLGEVTLARTGLADEQDIFPLGDEASYGCKRGCSVPTEASSLWRKSRRSGLAPARSNPYTERPVRQRVPDRRG